MKKLYFLLFLCLLGLGVILWYFLSWWNQKEEIIDIDITETWFEYDVSDCDQYFVLVECIIDKDTNPSWDSEMKLELKNQVKAIQQEWKQLSREELSQRCTYELKNLKKDLTENNLNSFGCYTGVN